MGIWHSEIASEITHKASVILQNLGEPGIDFEIEILPATSLEDEIILVKYANWPEDADLGQVWYWLFLTMQVESERYKLHPQAAIAAEFAGTPYGEFVFENDNIEGFCEIPWNSVAAYTESGGQDLTAAKTFLDAWACSYR